MGISRYILIYLVLLVYEICNLFQLCLFIYEVFCKFSYVLNAQNG